MSSPLRFHPLNFRPVEADVSGPGGEGRDRPGPALEQVAAWVLSALEAPPLPRPRRRSSAEPEAAADADDGHGGEGSQAGRPPAWADAHSPGASVALRATIPPVPPLPEPAPVPGAGVSEPPLMIVEITGRIRRGQHLLRPDADLNRVIAGVIGRAQHFTGVAIYGLHVLSNHLGLLVGVRDPSHAAAFTQRVFSQVSDRVGRLRGVRARHWGRRNRAIDVDGRCEHTPLDRFIYGLANGCKEGLVRHPKDWPGLHSARFYCNGEVLKGLWTDYTAWGRAQRKNPDAPERDFQTEYEVVQYPFRYPSRPTGGDGRRSHWVVDSERRSRGMWQAGADRRADFAMTPPREVPALRHGSRCPRTAEAPGRARSTRRRTYQGERCAAG